MSDDEYTYHYSDEDEDMNSNNDDDDDNNNNNSGSEEEDFEYTDDEAEDEEQQQGDDIEMDLENAYYNSKGLRENDLNEAVESFESLIVMEKEHLNKSEHGDDNDDDDDDGGTRTRTSGTKMGQWTFKSLKQMIKINISSGNFDEAQTIYKRLLACISNPDLQGVSPSAVEKCINGMLDRVSALFLSNSSSNDTNTSGGNDNGNGNGNGNGNDRDGDNSEKSPQDLARLVYDSSIDLFHPNHGTSACKNERLWFKTNLKYGQLLYENNETPKLRSVIQDLLHTSGLDNQEHTSMSISSASSSSSTQIMEIYALQIQLYSRLKDTSMLRTIFQKAMKIQGGIPHPRTLARIQEIGGKMHMASSEYESACTTFFQAFKSYDEAGDIARLRCLKYLVLASMLHASSINPFDSQEVRPYKQDPEIIAMTNLVDAFHANDIQEFESILKKNRRTIMGDEFIQEHIGDLLTTIRKQVLLRVVGPYTRISLEALSKELNGIAVKDVEVLLVPLILDGMLEGRIDQVKGILVKKVTVGSMSAGVGGGNGSGSGASSNETSAGTGHGSGSGPSGTNARGGTNANSGPQNGVALPGSNSIGIQTTRAIENLILELENLTSSVASAAVKSPDMHSNMMDSIRA